MELEEAIKTRRSIKKYLNIAVEEEKAIKLLEMAQYAPSAGNTQNWAFILIKDKEKRAKIAQALVIA